MLLADCWRNQGIRKMPRALRWKVTKDSRRKGETLYFAIRTVKLALNLNHFSKAYSLIYMLYTCQNNVPSCFCASELFCPILGQENTSYNAQISCVISQRESKQVLVGVKDSVSEQFTWDL